MFNTSGGRYKELGLKDSLESMSDTDALELLSSDGMLIKRPFVVTDSGETLLGFDEKLWKKLS